MKTRQDINGYQTVDCHNQYPITDQDVEQGKAVNAGNLQATMDYLLDGHPQGAVTSCQACEGTGYIDPEVSQGSTDEVRQTNWAIIKISRLMNYWRQVQLNVNERIQFFRYSHQAHGLL